MNLSVNKETLQRINKRYQRKYGITATDKGSVLDIQKKILEELGLDVYSIKYAYEKKMKPFISFVRLFGGWKNFKDEMALYTVLVQGYGLFSKEFAEFATDGVILPDGTFILCAYMGHIDLYSYLHEVDLCSVSHWHDDTECIAVSSGNLVGAVANSIKNSKYSDEKVTMAQLRTLILAQKSLNGLYDGYGDNSLYNIIMQYFFDQSGKGRKYANLLFLKEMFPEINLPKFSANLNHIRTKSVYVRTSPEKSLSGLLESRLVLNKVSHVDSFRREMKQRFNKICKGLYAEKYITEDGYKLMDKNKLHFFYQEFVDGDNGVAQIINGEVFIGLAKNTGDIVKGKTSDTPIKTEHAEYLTNFLKEFAEKADKDVQIEFVVANTSVYFVQLRLLEEQKLNNIEVPEKAFLIGKTFSKGYIDEVSTEDILVVDDECDSKLLLGKKALIVKKDVSFSHALALSRNLKIPSMFGTGDFDMEKGTVELNFNSEKGWLKRISMT